MINKRNWITSSMIVHLLCCAVAVYATAIRLNHSYLLFQSLLRYPMIRPAVFHSRRLIRMDLMVSYSPFALLSVVPGQFQPMWRMQSIVVDHLSRYYWYKIQNTNNHNSKMSTIKQTNPNFTCSHRTIWSVNWSNASQQQLCTRTLP